MATNISLLNSNNTNNINTNFQRVAGALANTVGRDGTTPNQMNADLDLNSNDLLNVNILEADDIRIDGVTLSDRLQEVIDARDIAVNAANEALGSASAAASSEANAAGSAADAEQSNIEAEYWAEQALQNGTGLVIASQAEAEAGVINTKAVTPLRTRQYIENGLYTPSIVGSSPQLIHRPLDHWSVVDLSKFRSGVGQGDSDIDTQAFILAAASGERKLRLSRGVYRIAETIELPVGVTIDGENAYRTGGVSLLSVAGGSYTENFMFFMNILKSSPDVPVSAFADIGAGGLRNVMVDGTATSGINVAKFAGAYEFENIETRLVNCCVRKPAIYTDKVKVSRLSAFNRGNNTDYFVDLPGLGDGYEISTIASGFVGPVANTALGASNSLGVRIGPARGCSVYGLINGVHRFYHGVFEIHGCHIEGGRIELEDCIATVHDNWLPADANSGDRPPIVLLSTGGTFGNRFEAKIHDNIFDGCINGRGGWPTTQRGDIRIHPHWNVVLEGNRRRTNFDGATDRQQSMGILVEDSVGALLPDFNNYSHILSDGPSTIIGEKVRINGSAPALREAFGGFNAISTEVTTGISWKAASGTYYYSAALVTDPIRLIGRQASGGAEQSIALTNGGAIPVLFVNWNAVTIRNGYMLRVYRGTAPGSYTQFADVPMMSVLALRDDGNALNNFVWKSRTAGGIDTFNTGVQGEVVVEEGRVRTKTTISTKPTVGLWKVGDRVKRETPAVPAVGVTFVTEFQRLTDGSAHIDGTDWLSSAETRFS